jgi:hypothetical protein
MARFRKALTAAALGAGAFALVAAAAGTTGAYFTDSQSGAINGSLGSVKVNTTALALNYANLLPGVFPTQNVTYTAAGTDAEDIWLVLPTDGSADKFNGQKGTSGEAPALGRYGHFAVTSPAGSFTSYNLTTAAVLGGTDSCTVNANGHGGSDAQATSKSDYIDYCPVPSAILLSSNLPAGQSATAKITFGFTKLLKGPNVLNAPLAEVAQFKIVATQHGVLPNDINNPTN